MPAAVADDDLARRGDGRGGGKDRARAVEVDRASGRAKVRVGGDLKDTFLDRAASGVRVVTAEHQRADAVLRQAAAAARVADHAAEGGGVVDRNGDRLAAAAQQRDRAVEGEWPGKAVRAGDRAAAHGDAIGKRARAVAQERAGVPQDRAGAERRVVAEAHAHAGVVEDRLTGIRVRSAERDDAAADDTQRAWVAGGLADDGVDVDVAGAGDRHLPRAVGVGDDHPAVDLRDDTGGLVEAFAAV